jgi:hypothetical protein
VDERCVVSHWIAGILFQLFNCSVTRKGTKRPTYFDALFSRSLARRKHCTTFVGPNQLAPPSVSMGEPGYKIRLSGPFALTIESHHRLERARNRGLDPSRRLTESDTELHAAKM